jgi:hypothetical protein
LTQQNEFQVISVTFEIYLEGGVIRELRSIEELQTYNETKNAASIAINITWVLLVKYHSKKHPEKQTVIVELTDGSLNRISGERVGVGVGANFALSGRPMFVHNVGGIYIEIQYTERTWGDDMEALLTGYILSRVKVMNNLKMYLRTAAVRFTAALFTFLITAGLLPAVMPSPRHVGAIESQWKSAVDVGGKLDVIFHYLTDRPDMSSLLEGVSISAAAGISVLLSIIIYSTVKSSHIVLNDAAMRRRLDKIRKERHVFIVACVAFFSSVLAGIVANNVSWIGSLIK